MALYLSPKNPQGRATWRRHRLEHGPQGRERYGRRPDSQRGGACLAPGMLACRGLLVMTMASPEHRRGMMNCHRLPARIVIAIWFAHRFARGWIRLLPKRIRVW